MSRIRHITSFLALGLALSFTPAAAEDARVEAAKKEGKVVWYTSLALPSAEKVAKLFEAAYPGVKVEVQRTRISARRCGSRSAGSTTRSGSPRST